MTLNIRRLLMVVAGAPLMHSLVGGYVRIDPKPLASLVPRSGHWAWKGVRIDMRMTIRTILNALLVAIVVLGFAAPAALGRADASPAPGSDPLATVDALFAALNSGDAAAAAAFYADNAVSGDAVGKAAIRARLELGIAAGFKHTRISGQVFDDGHVDVVDEVRGPFHALVTRTYEFDSAGKIVLSKELRSVVLRDDSAAPSQQQATTVSNTGTGPNRDDRDVGLLPLELLALGVCVAAGGVGVGVRASARRAPSR